jgi:uncharacterized protein YcbK (DUF882 family)
VVVKRKLWKFSGRKPTVNGQRQRPVKVRRLGLSPRAEKVLNNAGAVILALLAVGWSWTIAGAALADPETRAAARSVSLAYSLTGEKVPVSAYLTDALLSVLVPRPDSAADSTAGTAGRSAAASEVARVASRVSGTLRPIVSFNDFNLVPLSARREGRIGTYRVGSWPTEGRRDVKPRYEPPRGFIEVTRENQDTRVSEHFRLRDFLTKDQRDVWPKYLVLEPRLIEKLELVIAELKAMGKTVEHVTVMSGFRTPQYNRGGGNTSGRAQLSRHMYGDAADVFVDNDRNGMMDDLNGNGRADIGDSRVMLEAAERVEKKRPELVGGVGVYSSSSGHGPFTHIDTRGYRARW